MVKTVETEEEVSYSPLPQPTSDAPRNHSNQRASPMLRWMVVLFMVVNIAYFQHKLAPARAKLHKLHSSVQKCTLDENDVSSFSTYISHEIIETVKTDPALFSSLSSGAGGFTELLREQYNAWLSSNTSSTSTRGDLFPDNLFVVGDNIITGDFSHLLHSLHNFFHQMGLGFFSATGQYDGYYTCQTLSEISAFFGIAAEQVEPLIRHGNYTKDNSILGNFLTNLPTEVEETTSNTVFIEKTGDDCVTVISRFIATNWEVKWTWDGENEHAYLDPYFFRDILIACNTGYLGSQVPASKGHFEMKPTKHSLE